MASTVQINFRIGGIDAVRDALNSISRASTRAIQQGVREEQRAGRERVGTAKQTEASIAREKRGAEREVARALRDDPDCAGLGVDVAAWADEEAYYGSFLGSRSFIGELTEAEMDSAVHRTDGTPLRTALREAGYSGPRATVERGRHLQIIPV